MSHDVKSLAEEARELPPDQQAELIDVLIEGLSHTPGDWNASWSAEAERRWALLKAGKMSSMPAEQALSEIAREIRDSHLSSA